jgi:hypothetical protein
MKAKRYLSDLPRQLTHEKKRLFKQNGSGNLLKIDQIVAGNNATI